jgi:hypothetical protein
MSKMEMTTKSIMIIPKTNPSSKLATDDSCIVLSRPIWDLVGKYPSYSVTVLVCCVIAF